jgi:hypothetical protein
MPTGTFLPARHIEKWECPVRWRRCHLMLSVKKDIHKARLLPTFAESFSSASKQFKQTDAFRSPLDISQILSLMRTLRATSLLAWQSVAHGQARPVVSIQHQGVSGLHFSLHSFATKRHSMRRAWITAKFAKQLSGLDRNIDSANFRRSSHLRK